MTPFSFAAAEPALAANSNQARNAPLIDFALRGLDRCWLAKERRWSHIHHLDGRASPNESVPHSDVFYTLNTLLGLSRVAQVPRGLDAAAIFRRNARLLTQLPVRDYAFGMALWAGAELELELPAEVARATQALLADKARWNRWHAQDLGMLLTGVVAQTRAGHSEWAEFGAPLFQFLQSRFRGGAGLFLDAPTGLRRRFSSFATQVYLSIACYQYGDLTGEPSAIELASACVRMLISMQGPLGEWPWFYDAFTGRVLDVYEVYSVHQYGMAPALLEWAERYGTPGAAEARARGFAWMFGANQLERCMWLGHSGLSIRSQIRSGELRTKRPRMMRAILGALLHRSSGLIDPAALDVRLECRSYELGWILWAFGRRNDLPELTHHAFFTTA